MNVLQKLIRVTIDEGLMGAARRIAEYMAWRARLLARINLNEKFRVFIDRRFDRKYGVDTSGLIGVKGLDVTSEQKDSGIHYEPTPVPALRAILDSLPVDHSKFTFIDYGSGKGRVLLLASEYPYQRIIGVEFANSLHTIARANIARWNSRKQKCADIASVCMDARDFQLPDDPLVIFFFTPFLSPVIDRVVENIQESFRIKPRPIRIVYYGTNEKFMGLLSKLGFSRREIYSKRPFSALKHYKGHLFSSSQ
ncbi:hypothetical protein SCT_0260 [Sulfuricella sp. T08]|uniref:class I SAM-dependent methyltransferase n=1 Tax=Sulfuricella sp. T08 TaxID=1632857 RepID=UPI00061797ED|nr:class I SAM-dependent methyltransferase [Sulfuricella sp. T08]GAO34880.1 hypothetical protein SCT_0260 [Sulfuricella sp. T08]